MIWELVGGPKEKAWLKKKSHKSTSEAFQKSATFGVYMTVQTVATPPVT